MTIKFKKFDRFDPSAASAGVDHPIYDDADNYRGTWNTSLSDPFSPHAKLAHERFMRQHAKDPESNGPVAGIYSFVMTFVNGWSGVLDADDKEIPFSKKNAFDLLSADKEDLWLFLRLKAESENVKNYKSVPAATKEEDAKN